MNRSVFAGALALGLLAASPTSRASSASVSFSFVAMVDDRPTPYNAHLDGEVSIAIPESSPWRCGRQRISEVGGGEMMGSFACSADGGKTRVLIAASCGLLESSERHNSATLAASSGPTVTLNVNCLSRPFDGF